MMKKYVLYYDESSADDTYYIKNMESWEMLYFACFNVTEIKLTAWSRRNIEQRIKNSITRLPSIQQHIINGLFGFDGKYTTVEELASKYRKDCSDIIKIEQLAILHLRNSLTQSVASDYDIVKNNAVNKTNKNYLYKIVLDEAWEYMVGNTSNSGIFSKILEVNNITIVFENVAFLNLDIPIEEVGLSFHAKKELELDKKWIKTVADLIVETDVCSSRISGTTYAVSKKIKDDLTRFLSLFIVQNNIEVDNKGILAFLKKRIVIMVFIIGEDVYKNAFYINQKEDAYSFLFDSIFNKNDNIFKYNLSNGLSSILLTLGFLYTDMIIDNHNAILDTLHHFGFAYVEEFSSFYNKLKKAKFNEEHREYNAICITEDTANKLCAYTPMNQGQIEFIFDEDDEKDLMNLSYEQFRIVDRRENNNNSEIPKSYVIAENTRKQFKGITIYNNETINLRISKFNINPPFLEITLDAKDISKEKHYCVVKSVFVSDHEIKIPSNESPCVFEFKDHYKSNMIVSLKSAMDDIDTIPQDIYVELDIKNSNNERIDILPRIHFYYVDRINCYLVKTSLSRPTYSITNKNKVVIDLNQLLRRNITNRLNNNEFVPQSVNEDNIDLVLRYIEDTTHSTQTIQIENSDSSDINDQENNEVCTKKIMRKLAVCKWVGSKPDYISTGIIRSYEVFNKKTLMYYLWWREQVLKKNYIKTKFQYAELFITEIAAGVHEIDIIKAFEMISQIGLACETGKVANWLMDFAVANGLIKNVIKEIEKMFYDSHQFNNECIKILQGSSKRFFPVIIRNSSYQSFMHNGFYLNSKGRVLFNNVFDETMDLIMHQLYSKGVDPMKILVGQNIKQEYRPYHLLPMSFIFDDVNFKTRESFVLNDILFEYNEEKYSWYYDSIDTSSVDKEFCSYIIKCIESVCRKNINYQFEITPSYKGKSEILSQIVKSGEIERVVNDSVFMLGKKKNLL